MLIHKFFQVGIRFFAMHSGMLLQIDCKTIIPSSDEITIFSPTPNASERVQGQYDLSNT